MIQVGAACMQVPDVMGENEHNHLATKKHMKHNTISTLPAEEVIETKFGQNQPNVSLDTEKNID